LNVERESAKRFRWCCSRSLETRRLLSGGLKNISSRLIRHPSWGNTAGGLPLPGLRWYPRVRHHGDWLGAVGAPGVFGRVETCQAAFGSAGVL
jgi:hypothetical protein